MAASATINCTLYSYTPCCGGHPVYLARFDENGVSVIFPDPPGIPHVWQYNGLAPYTDHLGHSLIPGQCYYIQFTTITINGSACLEPYIVPSPTLPNFSETSHIDCTTAANDPKCNCPKTFEFVSCCTGESTIYNVTGIKGGEIVSGNTYGVALDLSDFTTLGCYTITETTVPNPELLPVIDIENIGDEVEGGCNDFFCFLLCQECRCEEFSGTSGTYQVFGCDFTPALIAGTVDGPQITYDGVNYEPLTQPLCLRYWIEQTFGLTRIDRGLCDIVYWNSEGSEINCPTYYKIVNCEEDANEEYCVSNDLSTEFSAGLVLTVNGATFANKCWRIEETAPCPQTITISFSITDISCEECLEKIAINFELINCNDPSLTIYTSTNLQDYTGSYITLDEYPEDCWYVQALSTSIPSDIPVTFNQEFPNCETCTGPQYLLEDCDIDNPDPNIITNTDLSAYVGQVVTLLNCPDKCWLVSETDPIPTPQLVNVTNNYQSCELCVQPTPIPEPPVYKYKSITPGYNTPGCEPDKFERIVCNFSEAMYRQIMVDAYGITPCCGEDDIKYEIKYELIKLKAIQDPDYDCAKSNSCECTTSISGLSQDNCQLTPPQPVVSYNCIETPTCIQYQCYIVPVVGGTLFYKDCDGNMQEQNFPIGKFPFIVSICSIPDATSNDIYVTGSTSGFTFTQTPVNCESTLECVEIQGSGGTYQTLSECQSECSPLVILPCDECIKILAVPAGGGTPIELTIPPTGTYDNGTYYYYFTIDGVDYEIYNETYNTTDPPGVWLLYAYDGGGDIGTFNVAGLCPIGTYTVNSSYFDSFVVEYCGGEPTGFVLYSVFLDSQGNSGVYFRYPDCNDITQQVDIPPSRAITNVFVCSKSGRLPGDFIQNGGTNFNVIETAVPCNC